MLRALDERIKEQTIQPKPIVMGNMAKLEAQIDVEDAYDRRKVLDPVPNSSQMSTERSTNLSETRTTARQTSSKQKLSHTTMEHISPQSSTERPSHIPLSNTVPVDKLKQSSIDNVSTEDISEQATAAHNRNDLDKSEEELGTLIENNTPLPETDNGKDDQNSEKVSPQYSRTHRSSSIFTMLSELSGDTGDFDLIEESDMHMNCRVINTSNWISFYVRIRISFNNDDCCNCVQMKVINGSHAKNQELVGTLVLRSLMQYNVRVQGLLDGDDTWVDIVECSIYLKHLPLTVPFDTQRDSDATSKPYLHLNRVTVQG